MVTLWYDPSLGRFTQLDSLIPNPGNPLDWDRYAYVKNNPMKYNDPSGHKACLLDENGNPETPDINASPVGIGTTINFSQKTYVECFYSRELLDISAKMNIDQKQMAFLIITVYYDLRHRSRV